MTLTMSESPTLLPLVKPLIEENPAAAARYLEAMNEAEAAEVVAALPPELAARVFPHLQVHYAAALLRPASAELMEAVVTALEPKRAGTILLHLDSDTRQRLLPYLPERMKWEIRERLAYPDDSVGRIMSTDYLAFPQTTRVRTVVEKLRGRANKQYPPTYVYVVDGQQHLVGVMNMHDMLVSDPDQTLQAVMQPNVFSLGGFTSKEEALETLSHRRYFAAPVVDEEGRLLGIVRTTQLVGEMQEEMTEDIQTMVGAGRDERAFSPMKVSLRNRLPWLHVNLVTAFMAAAVVAMFEGLIAQLTVLAVFLPVVAGQGGNAGAQSLAIVMRGLVMREIPANRRAFLVFKETVLGTVNGAVTGAVTGLIAWLWYGSVALGVVVGMGMIVNLLFAGLAGASIPLLMQAMRLDPAQCSSIILTTVTDVIGFLAFLGFALLFRPYLMGLAA